MLKSSEVSKLTGITQRQLQWWDERGYVCPKIERHRRLYDDQQVRALAVIAALKDHGVSQVHVLRVVDGDFWKLVGLIPPKMTGWLVWMHEDKRRLAYFSTPAGATEFAVKLKGPVTIAELKTP
jgi:hypothetical protein